MTRTFPYLPSLRRLTDAVIPLVIAVLLCGTAPASAVAADATDSLDIKIGQMLMTGFRGLTVRKSSPIAEDIRKYQLGGVILFDFHVETKEYGRNIASPMQLLDLTNDLQQLSPVPLLIAVDQEGGTVARMKPRDGFPQNVSHAYIGRINVDDTTTYYTDIMARSLAIVGVNLNFSPVLDLNSNPDNPIIGKLGRSISADPEIVAHHAGLMIDAYHTWGVFSAVKHFPGHGSSRDDSHEGFVDVTDTWSEDELEPYEKLIAQGKPDVVMTAHIFNGDLDATWPATLSAEIIDGLLRREMGFDGVVITDDMMMKAIADNYGMEAAVKQAVLAGVDLLLFANNTYRYDNEIAKKAFTTLKNLVVSGEIPQSRIETSYRRIMNLKESLIKKRAQR